jgi:hypothetical protein
MDKSETLATSGTRHNEVSVIQITVRVHRRDNTKWTNQRHWQHREQDTTQR